MPDRRVKPNDSADAVQRRLPAKGVVDTVNRCLRLLRRVEKLEGKYGPLSWGPTEDEIALALYSRCEKDSDGGNRNDY